jgi:hypothetical protein
MRFDLVISCVIFHYLISGNFAFISTQNFYMFILLTPLKLRSIEISDHTWIAWSHNEDETLNVTCRDRKYIYNVLMEGIKMC